MGKLFAGIVFFALGIFVAYLTSRPGPTASPGPLDFAQESNSSPALVARPERSSPAVDTSPASPQKKNVSKDESHARARIKISLPDRSISPDDYREKLIEAVRTGTLSSLQAIRKEYVELLPSYQEEVLPLIKREALNELLRRFTEEDWANWQEAALANKGNPSEARSFLDSVVLLNPDVGRFLETAAQLLHGMYLKFRVSKQYSLKEDLSYIIYNADEILLYRSASAIPARLLFDVTIIKDPVFLEVFRREKGRMIAERIERNPDDVIGHLMQIDNSYQRETGGSLLPSYGALMRRVTLEGTPAYREQVLAFLQQAEGIQEWSKESSEVRSLNAELFGMSAVDSLARKDVASAKEKLSKSIALHDGLKMQAFIASYIDEFEGLPAEEIADVGAEEADPGVEGQSGARVPARTEKLSSTEEADQDSFSIQTMIVWVSLLAAFGFIAVKLLLLYLAKRGTRVDSNEFFDEEHFEEDSNQSADFPELEFDSLDDIFDDVEVNR